MPLSAGDSAPDVEAPNQHGEQVAPDFEDATVVYFYPEDDTPGCTTEADQFDREQDAYADAGVAVYGVSTDTVDSHREFAGKHGIEFDLLADPDADLVDTFGVETVGDRAKRTTFVLADGEVLRVYENVNPDGHARDVLMDLLDDGVVDL
jgi:peroxiredoxin Q/BCP